MTPPSCKRKSLYSVILSLITLLVASNLVHPEQTNSANLTTVKDTLQSSRLSFSGRVKSPTAAGSTHVWIYTTDAAEAYSIDTAGLKVGDLVTIGGTNVYEIASIVDGDEFTVTTTLDAGDADDTDSIYLLSTPQHVVTFNTATAIADGFFRVLIPAATSNQNDSIPDSTGFDFGGTVDITASPSAGYTFSNNAATVSGGTGCTSPANYHCMEFHYSGAGAINTPIKLTIGATDGTNTPIAPAPVSGHGIGEADTYTVIVQNFSAGANPATATATDQSQAKIGVIESVRVTATVDPSITFTIAGIA